LISNDFRLLSNRLINYLNESKNNILKVQNKDWKFLKIVTMCAARLNVFQTAQGIPKHIIYAIKEFS